MGRGYDAICNACGTRFRVNRGHGLESFLLHCDRCGQEGLVDYGEIHETRLRYLQGLMLPDPNPNGEGDRSALEAPLGSPITEDEYLRTIEEHCGVCDCGGRFSLTALPRCPGCRSDDFRRDPDGDWWLYDRWPPSGEA